jgi:hypothetical protein
LYLIIPAGSGGYEREARRLMLLSPRLARSHQSLLPPERLGHEALAERLPSDELADLPLDGFGASRVARGSHRRA